MRDVQSLIPIVTVNRNNTYCAITPIDNDVLLIFSDHIRNRDKSRRVDKRYDSVKKYFSLTKVSCTILHGRRLDYEES